MRHSIFNITNRSKGNICTRIFKDILSLSLSLLEAIAEHKKQLGGYGSNLVENRNFSFVSKVITQQNPLILDGEFRNMMKIGSLHN